MGLLVEGHWQDQWYESSKDGAFQRENAQRRSWVTPMESRDRQVQAGLLRRRAAITCTCLWLARGHTARLFCASSRAWKA